jgi:hypothetical protein
MYLLNKKESMLASKRIQLEPLNILKTKITIYEKDTIIKSNSLNYYYRISEYISSEGEIKRFTENHKSFTTKRFFGRYRRAISLGHLSQTRIKEWNTIIKSFQKYQDDDNKEKKENTIHFTYETIVSYRIYFPTKGVLQLKNGLHFQVYWDQMLSDIAVNAQTL